MAVVVTVLLALPGCSGGGDGGASPTVPTSASSTSTTAAPDVSVIPAVIDEAYLNAVLAALDDVDGQAVRIIKQTKRFPPDAADLLNAIYSDEEFQVQAEGWLTMLAKDRDLSAIRSEPGNRRTRVHQIISSSSRCVWMAVERDHKANSTQPAPARIEYVALRPLDRSNDPKRLNRTAWMIDVEGYNEDGIEPEDQCLGS